MTIQGGRFLLFAALAIGLILLVVKLNRAADNEESDDSSALNEIRPSQAGIRFAAFLADGRTLRYFQADHDSRQPNYLWEQVPGQTPQKIFTQPIPGLVELLWSPDRTAALAAVRNIPDWAEAAPAFHTPEAAEGTTLWHRIDLASQTVQRFDPRLFDIRWSPDGKQIVYVFEHRVLAIAQPDGTSWQPLWDISSTADTDNPIALAEPVWPNPTNLFLRGISESDRPAVNLYHIDPASGLRRVVSTLYEHYFPSPDGGVVAGLRPTANGFEIEMIGTKKTIQTTGSIDLTSTIWSHDGRSFFYLNEAATGPALLRLSADSGQLSTLTNQLPAWPIYQILPDPDGRRLHLLSDEDRREIVLP